MDAKGRIALPSRFLDAFGKSMFLILGRDAGLWAYADEDWHRVTERIDSSPLSTREQRNRARTLFGHAERVNVDGQGRVVIPQFLRERAQLGDVVELLSWKAVVVDATVGTGGHAEDMLEAGVGSVVRLDRDASALQEASSRLTRFGPRFRTIRSTFSRLSDAVRGEGLHTVAGV